MTTAIHLTRRFEEATAIAPDEAHRAIDGATPIVVYAKSRTTETSVIDLPGLGRVVRKRWTWPRRRDRVKGALRTTWAARSPARREFDALTRLRALPGGPFAPEPLGYVEERERGVLRQCLLAMTEIAGTADLARWLIAERSSRARAQVLSRLAHLVHAMHEARLVDFEMHPRNVLVAPDGRVFKVDAAKQRRRARALSDADRARDLAALDVGLVRLATAAERAAFFRAYGSTLRLDSAIARELRRIDPRESKRLP